MIELPADDPERARRVWMELLGVELEVRHSGQGEGCQTHSEAPAVGVHTRGRRPDDSFSLAYFAVRDVAEALERVEALGGSVVHPGRAWAICKDSEGSRFEGLRGRRRVGRSAAALAPHCVLPDHVSTDYDRVGDAIAQLCHPRRDACRSPTST